MPAGQSIRTKSYPRAPIDATRFSMFFRVTLYRCRFFEMESRDKFFHRLSRINAWSKRHWPSSISIAVYSIRFSKPRSRSRFLSPMSASINATLWPSLAMDIPKFAVAVVLPTPPFPEVTTIVRVTEAISPAKFIQSLILLRTTFNNPLPATAAQTRLIGA